MNTQTQGREGRQHWITKTAACAIGAIALLYSAVAMACGGSDAPPTPEPTQPQPPAVEATATLAPTSTPKPTATPPPAKAEEPAPTATPPPEPTSTPEPAPPATMPPDPTPTAVPIEPTNPELKGIWWWKEQKIDQNSRLIVDYTPAGVLENHPYGPQLDLMDGRFHYHPEIAPIYHEPYERMRVIYAQLVWAIVSNDLTLLLREATGIPTLSPPSHLRESFVETGTIKWEVIDTEEAILRYWVEINGIRGINPGKKDYRIGFTVRWEIDEDFHRLVKRAYSFPGDRPPLNEYLGRPAMISDLIFEEAP